MTLRRLIFALGQVVACVTLIYGAMAKANEWKWSRATEVTRCFQTADVTVHCEDYSYFDGKQHVVQELAIDAVDTYRVKHSYGYLKAIEGSLCQEHLKRIRFLMRRTNEVCISASDEFRDPKGEAPYRWKGLETKRGKLVW